MDERPIEHRFVVGHPVSCLVKQADRIEDGCTPLTRKSLVKAGVPQPAVVPTSEKEAPKTKVEFRDDASRRFVSPVTYGASPRFGDVIEGLGEKETPR
ncbi:hypothetical protein [Micromonospora sp. NBC_01813]|uniref:hypothetical protein n=1 Tax=Micromonospora sp. NBC_01813 TaxID=2975988 RepID=UPI002DD8D112|nr:hypothetical protein [Micromonospora sp. NBC_01813]WSA08374.1 hypothetical protein OG958_30005 [Micromonospora sp. NBC_01813]